VPFPPATLPSISLESAIGVNDVVVAVPADYPPHEGPMNALDGDPNTKHANFGKFNTGLEYARALGPVVVNALQFTFANDSPGHPERDPTSFILEGSNDGATFALGKDQFLYFPIRLIQRP
jgi:hypothetical protein